MNEQLLQLIVLTPFASVALLYLLRKVLPPAAAGVIGCAAVLLPFACAAKLFLAIGREDVVVTTLSNWMHGTGLEIPFAFRLDSLSLTWTLVVTGIGFLIHVYSLGYMKGDPGFTRFFTYLNLFIGSMLVLVLGASLPVMFLGWEGVGLCSYLLIGFWFSDMENAVAGQKAFVVNRIGDLGFLLAMLLAFKHFGTLDIANLTAAVAGAADAKTLDGGTATAIALLLFVGACGKSAQIPLYTWLPDAMAGPTPVSALIHAATMVTAGIYMVARLNIFYALSPTASNVVAIVGGLTAFFAATIALRQRDIKKVLAYSTVSQLGFMFLALGVGAYVAAVFHVITHAFFKALLFLGAGSVIHALHHEQDVMKMGNLRKYLKTTHWTFLVGSLALSGIFPLSGFFSKDKILGEAFLSHGPGKWLAVLGFLTALMTAFYTFRLYTLAFKSDERLGAGGHGAHGEHGGHGAAHPHESPATMTLPLVVLALLAIAGGLLSLPLGAPDLLREWLEPIFRPAWNLVGAPQHHPVAAEIGLMVASLVLAVLGAYWASNRYARSPGAEADRARAGLPFLLENKWFVDEIYAIFVVGPMRALAHLAAFFDRVVVDGLVNGLARLCDTFGSLVRRTQDGNVQTYALVFIAGAALLLLSLL